jgi:hypothetical protein
MASDATDTTIDMLFSNEPAVPAALSTPEPNALQPQPIVTEQTPPAVPLVTDTALTQPPATPESQRQAERVPLSELMETRRRAQEAERQNAQLIEALQRVTAANQPQQPPQPAPEPIDPVADPERAYAALQHQMTEGMLNMHLNMSERYARSQPGGNEAVDQALEAAAKAGIAHTFRHRADPYADLVQWHQGQKLVQEVGPDPAAYRAKVEAEIRANLLASPEFRASLIAGLKQGQPAPQNLPPSLSTATKANGSPEVIGSDQDFFNSTINARRRG